MRWTIGARSTRIGSTRGSALARLVFAKGGINAAGEILGILGIDKRLRAQAASAGHDYAAEVVLFVLDPAARGHGLGPAHVRDADGRVPPGRRARLLPVHGHHMAMSGSMCIAA